MAWTTNKVVRAPHTPKYLSTAANHDSYRHYAVHGTIRRPTWLVTSALHIGQRSILPAAFAAFLILARQPAHSTVWPQGRRATVLGASKHTMQSGALPVACVGGGGGGLRGCQAGQRFKHLFVTDGCVNRYTREYSHACPFHDFVDDRLEHTVRCFTGTPGDARIPESAEQVSGVRPWWTATRQYWPPSTR